MSDGFFYGVDIDKHTFEELYKEYCSYFSYMYDKAEENLTNLAGQTLKSEKLGALRNQSLRPFVFWLDQKLGKGKDAHAQNQSSQGMRESRKNSQTGGQAFLDDEGRRNFLKALATKHEELDISDPNKLKLKKKIADYSVFKELSKKLESNGYKREGMNYVYQGKGGVSK